METQGSAPVQAPEVSRLDASKIVYSMLVVILFAPVVLAVGSAQFRLYSGTLAGVPTFAAVTSLLIVSFVGLCTFFSSRAFGEASHEHEDDQT